MKKLKYIFFLLVLSACDIDRLPEDALSDGSFWKSENDLKAAANYLYTFLPTHGGDQYDNWSDDGFAVLANDISSGTGLVPSTSTHFSTPYQLIRAANNIIEKSAIAIEAGVPAATVAIYVGEARFFRAWGHFQLVQKFGDVPLVMTTLNETSPELWGPRIPRDQVISAVYEDLDFAAEKTPTHAVRATANFGRITNTAALAFKARVALFEGTRAKYHGYGNPQKHLNIAAVAAKAVMDSKQHSLFANYFNLFQYAGEGFGNKENILVRQYGNSIADNVTSHNTGTIINGATNMTKALVDAILMKDGLPTDKSPLYVAPTKFTEYFNNRDPRFSMSIMKEGDPYSATASFTFPQLIYHTTGFCYRKFVAQTDLAQSNTSFIDLPIIRYAEVLLTYAEAKYELGEGISDEDLDLSLNLVRARAGMPSLSGSFVTANGLNMKEEIRRERRVEFSMEGLRYWDINRWKIAEVVLPKEVLGTYYFAGGFGTYNPQKNEQNFVRVQTKETRFFNPQKDYLWPLPITELTVNKELTQNPVWK